MKFGSADTGQSLIAALIGIVVLSVGMMAFLSMFKLQSHATRELTSLGGINDLSHALDTLFGSPKCANLGSGSFSYGGTTPVQVTFPGGTTPSCSAGSYSLSVDKLNFPAGGTAISTGFDSTIYNMIQPYAVGDIKLNALGGNDQAGGGLCAFPFEMQVTFTNSSGPPPTPLDKFITVYADPNLNYRVVGSCVSNPAYSFVDVTQSTNLLVPEAAWSAPYVWGKGAGWGAYGNTPTFINFDTVNSDNLTEYNTSTGKFTAKQSGYYSISVSTAIVPLGPGFQAGNYCKTVVFVNDVAYSVGATVMSDAKGGGPNGNACHNMQSTVAQIQAGQTVYVYVLVNPGGNANSISGHLLGPSSSSQTYLRILRVR